MLPKGDRSREARAPNGLLPAEQRDEAAQQRDQVAHQRDEAGDQRDQAAKHRDEAADQRDAADDQRDQVAEQRDEAAEVRDHAAEQSEDQASPRITADVLNRSARARRDAASDRSRASQDRGAGASKRTQAELDRHTALADRDAGASERTQAELDRNTALIDREASAKERKDLSVDGLTGTYLRGAGFVEIERAIASARQTGQPLVLAFVDVDRLKAINDTRGHAAGDRFLLEVADTLRANLRSSDLIVRYGGDEFICAIASLNMTDATKWFARVNAALADAPEGGSVSVGLAELQTDDSLEDLIARADSSLYRERQQERRP